MNNKNSKKKRIREKGERLKQIINCSTKLFYEKGFDGTSVQDIANSLGIKKASLYHYIESKDEILFFIMRGFIDALIESYKHAVDGIQNPLQKIHNILIVQLKTHSKYGKETAIFIREIDLLDKKYRPTIKTKEKEYLSLLVGDILKINKNNKTQVAEPEILSSILLGFFTAVNRLLLSKIKKPEEIAKDLEKFFFGGILAPMRRSRQVE